MSDQDPVELAREIVATQQQWREVLGFVEPEKSTAWQRLTAMVTVENLADLAVTVLDLDATDETNQELITLLHTDRNNQPCFDPG